MSLSPTQLSLRLLRENGYTAQVVEVWNPHARIRQDFLGIIDIIALRGEETLAVQCTSAAGVSARVKKMAESPNIGAMREANWRILCWGWAKINGRWVLTRKVDVS